MKLFITVLVAGGLAACGPIRNLETMTQTTEDMKQETKKLNAGMQKTVEATHRLGLVTALKELMSSENTEQLAVPVLMLPYAKAYTQEADPMEIIEIFHAYWIFVQYGHINNKDVVDAKAVHLQKRLAAKVAAGAIAAYCPADKFDTIVKDQITNKGRYEGTALAFAANRYEFIRDYLYEATITRTRTSELNLATVQTAVNYYSQMKQIAQFPFVNRLNFKIELLAEDPDDKKLSGVEVAVTQADARRKGGDMITYLKDNLPAAEFNAPEMQKLIAQLK